MHLIKLNESTSARRRVPVVLVDDTDGKSPETGITISGSDAKVTKNNDTESDFTGTLTEQSGGDYYYEFHADEVDSLGFLRLRIVKAGCRTYRVWAQVVGFDPYDDRLGIRSIPANSDTPATGNGLITTNQVATSAENANATVDAMNTNPPLAVPAPWSSS